MVVVPRYHANAADFRTGSRQIDFERDDAPGSQNEGQQGRLGSGVLREKLASTGQQAF